MAYVPSQLSFTNNQHFSLVTAVVASASGTSGATMFGSSLFLQRLYVPGPMNLSEIDLAMSFALTTSATSSTWGSINWSGVVFSFSNSTKLVSLYSTSIGISWNGSNNTTGAAQNFSVCDAAWSAAGGVIVPMTFASTELAPGDYVIGNLLAFSASSTASASLFGAMENTISTAAMTIGTGTIASTSVSLVGAANAGLAAFGSSNLWMHATATTWTLSATAGTTVSANAAMTYSASTIAGSYIGTTSSAAAATSVSMNSSAITAGTAVPAVTVPAFKYLGAGSSINNSPSAFMAGLMSTGGIPAAITLTTGTANALTTFGSTAFNQPWFALVGA